MCGCVEMSQVHSENRGYLVGFSRPNPIFALTGIQSLMFSLVYYFVSLFPLLWNVKGVILTAEYVSDSILKSSSLFWNPSCTTEALRVRGKKALFDLVNFLICKMGRSS